MDQYEKLKLEITDLNTLNEEQANLIAELTEENQKLRGELSANEQYTNYLKSVRTYKFQFGIDMVNRIDVSDEIYNQIRKATCEEIKARLKADPTIAEDYLAVVKIVEEVEKRR